MPFASKTQCRGNCGRPVRRGYCEACKAKGAARTERSPNHALYNYRWQRESKLYLQQHPIAVDYFGEHNGVVRLAEVVDHKVPHHGDLKLFWDHSNWQGLTKADHDRKTALEDGGFGRPREDGRADGGG
jgi:5-methylcytosine-specific restriction enzyme A